MPRLRLALALLFALPAAAALSVWLVGRTFTDSLALTQYLFWVPALFLLPPAALLAAGAWAVHAVGRPRRRLSPAGRRWRAALAALAVLSLSCLAWQLLIGWRLYRTVLPAPKPPTQSLSVLHWNMVAHSPSVWEANLDRLLDGPLPDLMLLTNAHWGRRFAQLHERTGLYTDQWRHLAVASRFPVRADGASLGLPRPEDFPSNGVIPGGDEPNPDPRLPNWYDPGQILVAEVDAAEAFGRPFIVWIIDLPSDPAIPRRDVADLVTARLAELDRQWREDPNSEFDGLPPPDLIAGDFNMTRGSAALAEITRGLPHAYNQAGSGFVATYPASRPLWHIDHIFVRRPLRALRYEVVDLGGSPHLAQRAVITSAGKP